MMPKQSEVSRYCLVGSMTIECLMAPVSPTLVDLDILANPYILPDPHLPANPYSPPGRGTTVVSTKRWTY
jgi:hypothetical protein